MSRTDSSHLTDGLVLYAIRMARLFVLDFPRLATSSLSPFVLERCLRSFVGLTIGHDAYRYPSFRIKMSRESHRANRESDGSVENGGQHNEVELNPSCGIVDARVWMRRQLPYEPGLKHFWNIGSSSISPSLAVVEDDLRSPLSGALPTSMGNGWFCSVTIVGAIS